MQAPPRHQDQGPRPTPTEDQAPGASHTVGHRYHACITASIECLVIMRLIRCSLYMAGLGALSMVFVGQSLEALRLMAEDSGHHWRPLMLYACAVFFLCFMCWYCARVQLYLIRPLAIYQTDAAGWAARHLPRICGIIPLVALAAALQRAAGTQVPSASAAHALLMHLAQASLLMSLVVYCFLWQRGRLMQRAKPNLKREDERLRLGELKRRSKAALLLAGFLWPVCFLVFTFIGDAASWFGPAQFLLLCIASYVPFGTLLVYWGTVTRLPLLTLVLLAGVTFSALDLNDNHMIRHSYLPEPELHQRQLRPEFDPAFTQWLEQREDLHHYQVYPVFLVAAEGGGLRAAYHTAGVLCALQDQCPAFAGHVFAISGVSGGSLGATVFAGLASQHANRDAGNNRRQEVGPLQRKADAVLKHDFLSPLLGAWLYPDLVQRFLPFPINSFDRARALEAGFERAWTTETGGHEFSRSFYDLWQDFPRQAVPALFLNTTRVETGDRMVICNLSLHDERFTQLSTLSDIDPTLTLPLSAAVGLSARFPEVTPAGYIPVGKDGHGRPIGKWRYADGGYFENSGTATLYDILTAMRGGEAKYARLRPHYKPIILRIGFEPKSAYDRDRQAKYQSEAFGEILLPMRALSNTRDARSATAIEQLRTPIRIMQTGGQPADMIEFQLKEGEVPLPTGWLLSNAARLEIKQQLGNAADDKAATIQTPASDHNRNSFTRVLAALRHADR